MRAFMFILVTMAFLAGAAQTMAAEPATAQPAVAQPAATQPVDSQPAPAPVMPVVDLEQLVELGTSVAAIRYENDNVFIYADRSVALQNAARSLEGGQVEFVAKVMRVSGVEVFVEVEPAGKTRLVPMHAMEPVFGNLRTVRYGGVSSTYRLHLFSAPVGLRIGSEIDLEMAKTLRRRDRLVLRGTIASLPVWIDSVFAPDAVALISDWSVIDVNPEPSY